MINKAYKIRLYPNKKQSKQIDVNIGHSRFIFNQMLNEKISVYEKLKGDKEKLYSHKYKTEKEYKQEFEFLKLGSSRALQQSRRDLDTAFKNFYRNLKKGKKVGFPKFKKKSKVRLSYREPQIDFKGAQPNAIELNNKKIKLLKLGWVKHKGLSKKYSGIIKSITVSRDKDGKYYASILAEKNKHDRKLRTDNQINGIDLGLKEFITVSNGQVFNGIKNIFKTITKKIDKANKNLSRKNWGSNRYEKQRKKLNRLYKKRASTQNHFFWHLANKLCSENQVIVLENLNVAGMIKNRKLSKAISNVSWNKFLEMLKQKALEYGTEIYQVGRFFPSSKLCSNCGQHKSDLKLSDRTYICDCGLEIDRDLNAAINLRNKFLSSEFGDYECGEAVSLSRLFFDLKSSFVETFTENEVLV